MTTERLAAMTSITAAAGTISPLALRKKQTEVVQLVLTRLVEILLTEALRLAPGEQAPRACCAG